jgi:hypothetical protein
MGFNSAFKGLKLLKTQGNGLLNNINDPVLNLLSQWHLDITQVSSCRTSVRRSLGSFVIMNWKSVKIQFSPDLSSNIGNKSYGPTDTGPPLPIFIIFSWEKSKTQSHYVPSIHPSIHLWRYSPFRALVSLIRCLHLSLFAALLLHPLIPSSCSASLWTTSAHLVLGLPTGIVLRSGQQILWTKTSPQKHACSRQLWRLHHRSFLIRKELKRIERSDAKREGITLQNIYIRTVSSETPNSHHISNLNLASENNEGPRINFVFCFELISRSANATNWFFGARRPEWSRVLQVSHHRPTGIWPLS